MAAGGGERPQAVDYPAPVTGWEVARAPFQSCRPLPRPMGSGAPKARPSHVAPGCERQAQATARPKASWSPSPERPPRSSRQAVASPDGAARPQGGRRRALQLKRSEGGGRGLQAGADIERVQKGGEAPQFRMRTLPARSRSP